MQLHEEDFRRLAEVAQEDHARIPETVFVQRLLPYLVPPALEEREITPPRDMSIWIAAAGNPHRPIDVIGPQGTVLYTVPPLLSRTPSVIPERDYHVNLIDLARAYDDRMQSEPPAVVNQWFAEILQKYNFGNEEGQRVNYLMQWVHIYRRYNIPLERLLGAHAAEFEKALNLANPAEAEKPAVEQGSVNHDLSGEFEAL
jgi:hypothetical protein